jgi:pyoverdine/dityrosine biosynthesis protein Dit1
VTTVDYSNYLEQQNQWASSLCQLARKGEPEQASELVEIAAATLHRMLRYSFISRYMARDSRFSRSAEIYRQPVD